MYVRFFCFPCPDIVPSDRVRIGCLVSDDRVVCVPSSPYCNFFGQYGLSCHVSQIFAVFRLSFAIPGFHPKRWRVVQIGWTESSDHDYVVYVDSGVRHNTLSTWCRQPHPRRCQRHDLEVPEPDTTLDIVGVRCNVPTLALSKSAATSTRNVVNVLALGTLLMSPGFPRCQRHRPRPLLKGPRPHQLMRRLGQCVHRGQSLVHTYTCACLIVHLGPPLFRKC